MTSYTPESYQKLVNAIHSDLGIDPDYAKERGLELQCECQNLVEAEPDVFNRQPLMEQNTYLAWQDMKSAAAAENVELALISAYRSAIYQKELFLKKLGKGQKLPEILKVNAAPGYSEHHTGQALDLGTTGVEHLSKDFENSRAFQWLEENSGEFGFSLSFPRNNPQGFLYEPWHWKFS